MSRKKIIVQKGYWITMLETAKYNKWDNNKIATEILKGIEEALNIVDVSNQREFLLNFAQEWNFVNDIADSPVIYDGFVDVYLKEIKNKTK